jgi:RNA polymerase sigma factor (sigma-70 family)
MSLLYCGCHGGPDEEATFFVGPAQPSDAPHPAPHRDPHADPHTDHADHSDHSDRGFEPHGDQHFEPPGDLLLRARTGDGAAWAALTRRYSNMLWAIARTHGLGDADAADVVQTTWLRLVERLDRIRKPDRVGAWLAVTARRESLRLARYQGRDHPAGGTLSLIPAPAPAPDDICVERERLRLVMAAIQALPELCRHVLRLCALSPGYAEIAAALDIPIGSVGPTRARCLSSLRDRIGGLV